MGPSRHAHAVVALALVFGGCGRGEDPVDADATGSPTGSVTVVAAASLADAFEAIEDAFEARHDAVDVQLTTDGSAALARAIVEGAPVDVFASADTETMAIVADAGLLRGAPITFATNDLQIVVAKGNPLGIDTLEDLTASRVTVSLCGPAVPCGRYAAQLFEEIGKAVPPAGTQDSVRGVLTQVQLGEADAGIVYVTDVLGAEGVEGIDLAPTSALEVTYPVAALAGAANPEAAEAFVAFLAGDEAQSILRDRGFGPP